MAAKILDPTSSVNDALLRFPAAVTVLSARGIDTCCRGNESIATAAANSGISAEALINDIANAPASDALVKSSCSCSCSTPTSDA
ncbi:MAG: DUF542 domain-containing protein [Gemmatimonadaceae bacterium]